MMGVSLLSRCISLASTRASSGHRRGLRKRYRVTEVIDASPFEDDGCCLEGAGSLVFDHLNKIAYSLALKSLQPKGDPTFCR